MEYAVCKRRSICVMSARNIRAQRRLAQSKLNNYTPHQNQSISRRSQTVNLGEAASRRRGGA